MGMDIYRWTLGGGPVGAGTDWATKKVFGDAAGGIMNTAAPWNLTNPNAYKEGHRATAKVLGNIGLGGGGGAPPPQGGQTPFRVNPAAVQQADMQRRQQMAGDQAMMAALGDQAPANPSIQSMLAGNIQPAGQPGLPSPMMAGPAPYQRYPWGFGI